MLDQSTKNIFLSSGKFEKEKQYWLNHLNGDLVITGFPGDYMSGSSDAQDIKLARYTLPATTSERILKISRRVEFGVYTILTTCVNWLLHKYTGETDITVGMPIFKQSTNQPIKLINQMVALRTCIQPHLSFQQLLMQVKTTIDEANQNLNFPYEILAELLQLPSGEGQQSLFKTIVQLTNIHEQRMSSTVSDLLFSFTLYGDQIECEVKYQASLYHPETVDQIINHLFRVVDLLTTHPNVDMSQLEIVSAKEKEKILFEFNDTQVPLPAEALIHQLFEQQVALTPKRLAVVLDTVSLTYGELNDKANQLARVLREEGVQPDQVVGIMVHRSVELIIGILAIIKAGGAYLPISRNFTQERIAFLLQDSDANILLTMNAYADLVSEYSGEVLYLDDERLFAGDTSNLVHVNKSTDLLYVMYTSGTTGKPKGTLIEHRNVCSLVLNTNFTTFDENEQILQAGAIDFDATTFEFWGSLLNGGCLHLIDEHVLLDARLFAQTLQERKITSMFLTNALFTQLSEEDPNMFEGMKKLLVGGETLSVNSVNRVRQVCKYLKVTNVYGPTENTTFSTFFPIAQNYKKNIPIGRPIANSTAYIVDTYGNLQMIGMPGEIYVGGQGVARGYLNVPELTAEKFIPSPFKQEERLYKTGDLGRWLSDGSIEYLGRIDNQVKIRGFRVELQEIEQTLLRYPYVKEALVTVHKDENAQKYLCGYIATDRDDIVAELRSFLNKELPDYMIPPVLIQLNKFPLTPNGKADRRALPEPELTALAATTEYVAPRNPLEEQIQSIWQEILGVERIGVTDLFFDLGGHSLKAMALVSRLRQVLHVEVGIKEIFTLQSIEEQANFLASKSFHQLDPIERVKAREWYPLSSAQKRMIILDRITNEKKHYNIPLPVHIKGPLVVERLQLCWQTLIDRHEALRTSFDWKDGEPVQRVHSKVNVRIPYVYAEDHRLNDLMREFLRPFDLSQSPLLRIELIELSSEHHVMLIDTHHIISDGVTLEILLNELAELYEGRELPEVKLQYIDFSAWQNKQLSSEPMKQHEAYWLGQFEDEIPLLQLPTDYVRPPIQQFVGTTLSFTIEERLHNGLKKIAASTGTTLYMVLLAVFKVLLSKYSRQQDIVVGTPITGRTHADTEKIVGMFVNTLAIRTHPTSDKSFHDYLEEVKESSIQAFEHQDYQFEDLVEKLKLHRDSSRNPLFDVLFSMQNMDLASIQTEELTFEVGEFPYMLSKFDLTLHAQETKSAIDFAFEYTTNLFTPETIQRMVQHFQQILQAVIADSEQKLGSIVMLTEAERHALLLEWNQTERDVPRDRTVHELFESQASKSPDRLAVVYGEHRLTYQQLDEQSNQLARVLRDQGCASNQIVALIAEPSVELIIAILAVLKAGGAYLPIDPEMPNERIRYILHDSGARLLLHTGQNLRELTSFTGDILDICDTRLAQVSSASLEPLSKSTDLVYVIYTSGSTGLPKGVMLEHCNLVNYVNWFAGLANLTPEDKTLLISSYAFDMGYTSLYPALLSGCELHLVDKNLYTDPHALVDYIGRNRLTFIKTTPTMFSMMRYAEEEIWYRATEQLRLIVSGGEPINVQDVTEFHSAHPQVRILNHYGPTETCIGAIAGFVQFEECLNKKIMPIGRPIANMQAYVLDADRQVLPVGVPGELYLSGYGLARSYLNQPVLTAEKFIEHPFRYGERLYRTGDVARFWPNGQIEFLGRADNQVKIRGYRVELGEIEIRLLQHPEIRESVVLVKDNQYLVAYVVTTEEQSTATLRDYLSHDLPTYMVPSFFVRMEQMPLTANGKINRKALPEVEDAFDTVHEYTAPQDQTEKILIQMWEEVLGLQNIGTQFNFFDVGGNSLLMIRLHALVDKQFGGVVTVADLFAYPTILKLAEFIRKQTTEERLIDLKPIQFPEEYFAWSSEQARGSLNLYLEGEAYERLRVICDSLNSGMAETMAGLFLYLLAELSEQQKAEIQVSVDGTGNVLSVQIDLDQLERIEDLVGVVQAQIEDLERLRYRFADVETSKINKTNRAVLGFAKKSAGVYDQQTLEVCDVYLIMDEGPHHLYFECEYNGRIQKVKVREMMEQYLQVIQSFTDHFHTIQM
ncbi:amino acid adenylation domain-containing protein [Alicyclobacillus fodiniaquatilis]|uniref:Amino acid adenylation domain-containing protein n=1 Tax=Alicyclobacillus fodiniaquatilis TaxID=1661150 RepID=A0ABW4JJ93_9BACL